ncbi:hypothetical protein CHCC20331_2169 [Bacillus paralicheniformis]|nr:hypothetical protein CHCC20331_2169 [Bacillus paralicheniformis]TWL05065.1 hypothetical protein CHCC19468_3786 [Bacillus paralicheniformis]TWL14344.1 hypothetical protein CHCC19467_1623 [Bacillus paralicheniformis]TWL42532.1 hypothetical protein CHCC15337_0606 [Bacillus paralicheniformis]TWL48325.1 hypothetical protein CHCC15332_4560 [Bacillus paralicheniformis]
MSAVLSFLSVKWQRYDRQGKCMINRLFSAADILKRPAGEFVLDDFTGRQKRGIL